MSLRSFQFGHFVLPVYAIFMALGWLIGLLVAMRASRLLSLNSSKIWNLALIAAVAWLGGAKILLAAAHWRSMGMAAWALNLAGAPWAMTAGVFFALAAGWGYGRKVRLPLRRAADALAPAFAAGGAVAWMGSFETGYGFGLMSRQAWGVVYTSANSGSNVPLGVPLIPVQIYQSVAGFALFTLALLLIRLPHRDGDVMGVWLFLNGLCEFFLSLLRGDAWGSEPVLGFLSGAQWCGIAMVAAGGLLLLQRSRQAPSQGADKPLEISAG